MIFCGLIGATIAGLLIDYTKRFKEITIVSLSMAILCLIWFMEVSELPKIYISILVVNIVSNCACRCSPCRTNPLTLPSLSVCLASLPFLSSQPAWS